MSATVTCALAACRSYEWNRRDHFLISAGLVTKARARGASPLPRSVMVQEEVLRRGRGVILSFEEVVVDNGARMRMAWMKVSTGLVGQEVVTCWEKPAWYSAKREGVSRKRVRAVLEGVV